tara:strand:- start:26178 stop:27125 length:948 start_codon:yes stop_codon:yes gene_type:complete
MDQGFEGLLAQITGVMKLSEEDAHRISTELYRGGVKSLTDGAALFDINARLAGSDTTWDRLFVSAVRDYVLLHSDPRNWVTEDEADWLIEQIDRQGACPIASEVDLLLQIMRYAEGVPDRLGYYTLKVACARISQLGKATAEDVERVRRALIVPVGEGGGWVTGVEAELLVRTNDKIGFAANDPSWNDLFARAIANHLMARAHPEPKSETSILSRDHWIGDMRPEPGTFLEDVRAGFSEGGWFAPISQNEDRAEAARRAAHAAARREADISTEDEASWFLKCVGEEKSVSLAERALLDFLKLEAPGFTQGLAVAS